MKLKAGIFKWSVVFIVLLPFIILSSLFLPGVQKYLFKNHLGSWISAPAADYIHITPFSFQVNKLSFNYEDFSIVIDKIDSEFSLLELFDQRIKIERLLAHGIEINNASVKNVTDEKEPEQQPSSALLFPGVFPYLDNGFIFDIGQLAIQANYHSITTGSLQLSLSAESINEHSDNPLQLQLSSNELPDAPELQDFVLDASIVLSQHARTAIDAAHALIKISLNKSETEAEKELHQVSIDLKLKQLPQPQPWAAFPFDKRGVHYLKQILHPEHIQLQITHDTQKQLKSSHINFDGTYDGNEGIIDGHLNLLTDKAFLQNITSGELPEIDSQLNLDFEYNTRSLDGKIHLVDEFKTRGHTLHSIMAKAAEKTPTAPASMPQQIILSNQLNASIHNAHLLINQFTLNMVGDDQDYIKIFTHKPLSININAPLSILDQQQSELLNISINQLPLEWFNDFIPQLRFEQSIMDTQMNLSIENQTLIFNTIRPFTLQNLNLVAEPSKDSSAQQDSTADNSSDKNEQILLSKQNLSSDFTVLFNQQALKANIKQLELFHNPAQKKQQVNMALEMDIQQPMNQDVNTQSMTIKTRGQFHINELLTLPLLEHHLKPSLLKELSLSLPKQLNLSYDFSAKKEHSLLTIRPSSIDTSSEDRQAIITINTQQDIELKQTDETYELQTSGNLLAAKIKHLDFSWFAPVISHFATPYDIAGLLRDAQLSVSSTDIKSYDFYINRLNFTDFQVQENEKILLKNIILTCQLSGRYSKENLTITYPRLSVSNNKNSLIEGQGTINISDPGQQQKQQIAIKGEMKGALHNIMALDLIGQYTELKLTDHSQLNADYDVLLNHEQAKLNQSHLFVFHPQSRGRFDFQTLKPVTLSLKEKEFNFNQDGHLDIQFTNFDLKPYDKLLSELPLSFKHINGHIDLVQTKKTQTLSVQKPLVIHKVHYKNSDNALLNPFDVTMNFNARQVKNISQGEIDHLTIAFLDRKEPAMDLKAKFKLDLNENQPITQLESQLSIQLPQWLKQPGILPLNTLKDGSLSSRIQMFPDKKIKHQWLISNLVDQQDKKIIESLTIDGDGELGSFNEFKLNLPMVMKSKSGISELDLNTQIQLLENNKHISVKLKGKELFINDLLTLLTAINPESELSKFEKNNPDVPDKKVVSSEKTDDNNVNKKSEQDKTISETPDISIVMDKTPAESPFWPTGIAISSHVDIEKMYYNDYMSFHSIQGKLEMNDKLLHASNFTIKFHDSPMTLNSHIQFNPSQKQPYDIQTTSALKKFNLGAFLRELEPGYVPRSEGVFDIDLKFLGGLSNLSQLRNELLFDLDIQGSQGVFHLIPQNDVMLRTSGHAMAIVGEVVSVLPTSGFGLGIINRVVRFAKDIDYDYFKLHLYRKPDLNTVIDKFQIISPELHLLATGDIKFKENTRLLDQALKMNAQLSLSGEGAAIFYGLGLLNDEQDNYGFWKGPEIKFWGSLSDQHDNFNDIINAAKEGTLAGGVTNPFSGLVGNYRYRWTGTRPDYSELIIIETNSEQTTIDTKSLSPSSSPIADEVNKEDDAKEEPLSPAKSPSFFDETF